MIIPRLSDTFRHTNIFEQVVVVPHIPRQTSAPHSQEITFRSCVKRIDVGDNAIFSNQPIRQKRELKTVNRPNPDHSAEYFYNNNNNSIRDIKMTQNTSFDIKLINAVQRKDVYKLIMHDNRQEPQKIQPKQHQLSVLLDWAHHDSIQHRLDTANSPQYHQQRYKNASTFSQHTQQNRKTNELTSQRMNCKKQLDQLEGMLPNNYTYSQTSVQQAIIKSRQFEPQTWNQSMSKFRKQYYKQYHSKQ